MNVSSVPAPVNQPSGKEILDHPVFTDLLRKAYSAEKAAAFAYPKHAASVMPCASPDTAVPFNMGLEKQYGY